MKLTEYDAPGRYLAQSETRPEVTHLVDVVNNWCACEDHQFRNARCKHLLAARETFLDSVIALMKKQHPTQGA